MHPWTREPSGDAAAVDPDLDPADAFGHTVLPDPARDDGVWDDEDDDDIDV
ncbi:hypothetical protein [Curtobacterium sp. VKM Ac-2922]|uniref:hypothetical protein n=1 Tax=Curtobacterium sp. VKM Ac-2922 TaxID=2929475 RepID=UPI001FB376F9|nr:hypothetical protein [Curtobacterium sp. VKM Ac-2922]MCJ1715066.1 hypothetical protein [Curtobacterium sp. VKM Ac-2922]